jgi:hypothetical protein
MTVQGINLTLCVYLMMHCHDMIRSLAWCQLVHQNPTQNHLELKLGLHGKRPLPIAQVMAQPLKMQVKVCVHHRSLQPDTPKSAAVCDGVQAWMSSTHKQALYSPCIALSTLSVQIFIHLFSQHRSPVRTNICTGNR